MYKKNNKIKIQVVTVKSTPKDNRLEKDKPKKSTLKYIDLDSII